MLSQLSILADKYISIYLFQPDPVLKPIFSDPFCFQTPKGFCGYYLLICVRMIKFSPFAQIQVDHHSLPVKAVLVLLLGLFTSFSCYIVDIFILIM